MASRCLSLSRWRPSSTSAATALANRTLCISLPVVSPHWRPHQSFFSSQAEKLKEDEEAGPWLQGATDVSHPTYMVWGANTGVGKTLVSAGLSSAIFSQSRTCKSQGGSDLVRGRRLDESKEVLFVKPVQTGFPSDSDARFVFREVSRMAQLHPRDIPHGLFASNHTLRVSSAVRRAVQRDRNLVSSDSALDIEGSPTGMADMCSYESQLLQGFKFENSPQKISETDAVAANSLNGVDKDDVSIGRPRALSSQFTCKTVWAWLNPVSPHLASVKEGSAVPDSLVLDSLQSVLGSLSESPDKVIQRENTSCRSIRKWAIVETAGGVASPGPSGTLQCDLYRPLRFPGVLVGDGRLGGISTTIGAYESLCSRGYDIPAIVLMDAGLRNETPLQQYLQYKIPVLVLPPLPQDPNENLEEWFAIAEETFAELRLVLENSHLKRLRRLEEMPKKASQILWWPFTQHDLVPEESITLIDSCLGDNFSVYKGGWDPRRDTISLQFDACASWWTQGPDASLQSELARAAAHTAGRYGHVMFPENVHEPALQCAELLLQGVGRGWADRVFFSDNGATAVEVAIKMAFRKYIIDHNLHNVSSKNIRQQFKVLALKGSYHGDTLGALEAQAPSAYTGFLQQPWYSGRGLFLEPPTVFQQDGRWVLNLPEGYSTCADIINSAWRCRDEIFDLCRNSTTLAKVYSEFIGQQLYSSAAREESTSIAALIIEPVIHGAGGMEMLDPLFQRILVQECRKRCIPVIFDEVLSGCWRFGTESAAELLRCSPDIACYSKLLTGGLVPLSATLAAKPVFEAFRGGSKLDALLHGHSYTAHAIGCSSAVLAIKYFSDPSRNANLLPDGHRLRELWSPELVSKISSHHAVHRVVSLGTIMALELRASSADGGYGSMISKGLVEGLRLNGIYTRPLGNVVYLMCGPLTHPDTCTVLLQRLLTLLEDYPVQSIMQR